MKNIFLTSLLILFLSFLASAQETGQNESFPPIAETNPLHREARIATWNIRILSDGSRDDEELTLIASLFDYFDFVALQEVRDREVLERLSKALPGWTFLISEPVGAVQKERYSFFYREDLFEPLSDPFLLDDPEDRFLREPYIGQFRSGAFDFVVITIHTVYGSSIRQRRAENSLLDEVIMQIERAYAPEADIFLMGDFNLPANDRGWDIISHLPMVSPELMTTIQDSSSYDNIWYSPEHTNEFDHRYSVIRFDEFLFNNDDAAASRAVSDHRPVVGYFRYSGHQQNDDD